MLVSVVSSAPCKSRFLYAKWCMLTVQVEKWDRKMLMHFWEKWYFPANAVLYIVGDLSNSVAEIEGLIEKAFGGVPAGREKLPGGSAEGALHNGNGAPHSSSNGASKDEATLPSLKQKHEVGPAPHFPWPSPLPIIHEPYSMAACVVRGIS